MGRPPAGGLPLAIFSEPSNSASARIILVSIIREPFLLPRFTVSRGLSRRMGNASSEYETRAPYYIGTLHTSISYYFGNVRAKPYTLRACPGVTLRPCLLYTSPSPRDRQKS